VLRVSGQRDSDKSLEGLIDVIVCEADHPFMDLWWPSAHILGWEHSHINMLDHFLRCVTGGGPVGPEGATFEDGYRAALITECMHQAAEGRQWVDVPTEN